MYRLVNGQARVAALAFMAAWAPQIQCRTSGNRSDFFGHFVGAPGRRHNWKNKAAAMAKRVAKRRAKKGYR